MADRLIGSEWPDLFFALNFHRTTHNERMDFGHGRYALIDLYKDDNSQVRIMKAVQVGITDRAIIAALSRMYRGWSILYSFPTEQFRNREVGDRVDPLLNTVPFYKAGIKNSKAT